MVKLPKAKTPKKKPIRIGDRFRLEWHGKWHVIRVEGRIVTLQSESRANAYTYVSKSELRRNPHWHRQKTRRLDMS